MGRISFENYGKRAELLSDFTFMTGRYPIQKEAFYYSSKRFGRVKKLAIIQRSYSKFK